VLKAQPKPMLSILVIEDELEILREIERHILTQFYHKVQVIGVRTFEDAKYYIKQEQTDIFIIDLYLPDGTGEDLVAMIREQSTFLPIILQTREEDMVFIAKFFMKHPNIRYIVKKELNLRLAELLHESKLLHRKYTEAYRIGITGQSIGDMIDVKDICYIEKIRSENNLHVHLYDFENETYKTYTIKNMALSEFEEQYNDNGYFLRCNRSFIVSIRKIQKYFRKDRQLAMISAKEGGINIKIDIGETYKEKVDDRLRGWH